MISKFPKWVKWVFGILISLLLSGLVIVWFLNEPLPEGKSGEKAEELADKLWDFTQKKGWDSTGAVMWSFPGEHHYIWDKKRDYVQIKWNEYSVHLHTKSMEFIAKDGDKEISEPSMAEDIRDKAWKYFCNDSYWLAAPFKIRDKGTSLKFVELGDKEKGLLVTYNEGGVTPGDSYLWVFNSMGTPQYWKMWTEILPYGGVKFEIISWKSLITGARIPDKHKSDIATLELKNIKGGYVLEDIAPKNLFEKLDKNVQEKYSHLWSKRFSRKGVAQNSIEF